MMPDHASQPSPPRATPAPRPRIDTVYQALRRRIHSGAVGPNSKLPSIQQLSREFGVTPYRVREAVLALVQEGVLVTRRGAGTFVVDPAQPGPARSSRPVAAVDSSITGRLDVLLSDAGDDQSDRFLSALTERFAGSGIALKRVSWRRDEPAQCAAEVLEHWQTDPPAAAVIQCADSAALDVLAEGKPTDTRVVEVFRCRGDRSIFHEVSPDYALAYRAMADRLIDMGHRRLGLVDHRRSIRRSLPNTARRSRMGQTHAMRAFAGRVRERLGRGAVTFHHQTGDPRRKVDDLIPWLGRPDRPTAVCGQDYRMAHVIRAADRLGLRVPDDLVVLGIGNTMWAEEFAFPSVDLRLRDIADHVYQVLHRDARALRSARVHVLIDPAFIDR